MRRGPPALALVLWAWVAAAPASAHPLGNFTVNVYSGLRAASDRVDIELVVDMAEIPTFQARAEVESAGPAYAPRACASAKDRLHLRVDGEAQTLRLVSSGVAFPPGSGGLPTLRLTCGVRAELSDGDGEGVRSLRFQNRLYDDRVGWREITAVGDGATILASDVPATSVSAALTAYPDDLLSSPLRRTEASLRVRPGGSGVVPAGDSLGLPRAARDAAGRYTTLVGGRLTLGAGALALVVAVGLGAAHSLAPGHGKTLIAAYLLGRRGSVREAAAIGLTVTLTHTAGVLALGVVLSAFSAFAPDRLYPWFGVTSGAIVSALGVGLVRRAWSRRHDIGVAHGHGHGHGHAHLRTPVLAAQTVPGGGHAHPGGHRHDHHDHGGDPDHHGGGHDLPRRHGALSQRRDLLAMGLAGGIVPTPSAVVVLLAAIALGRAWFGVVLVVAYGLGMAAALTAAGFALVRVEAAVERRLRPGSRLSRAAAKLPLASAAAVVVTGAYLVGRGIGQL